MSRVYLYEWQWGFEVRQGGRATTEQNNRDACARWRAIGDGVSEAGEVRGARERGGILGRHPFLEQCNCPFDRTAAARTLNTCAFLCWGRCREEREKRVSRASRLGARVDAPRLRSRSSLARHSPRAAIPRPRPLVDGQFSIERITYTHD